MSGTRLLVSFILLLVSIARTPAQETNYRATLGRVSMAKLVPPVYPPVAKQARITGDVQLALVLRADGTIESASTISGHPLLQQAALDSAEHSQFVCEDCDKEPQPFRMIYSFQLGPAVYCTESSASTKADAQEESYPRVVRAENHVTLYDRPVGTCDLAFKMVERKVRSIKCMYLWKCGLADWHEEPLNEPQTVSGRVVAYSVSPTCLNGNGYWSVLIHVDQPTNLNSQLIRVDFSLPCDKSPGWISTSLPVKSFRLVRNKGADAILSGCLQEQCQQKQSLPIWKRLETGTHDALPFGQSLPSYRSLDLPLAPVV